jgi:hypothetical protein
MFKNRLRSSFFFFFFFFFFIIIIGSGNVCWLGQLHWRKGVMT